MAVYEFGSGTVWATPNAGNLAANPTPIQVGTLQDISVDISFAVKKLKGRSQFPDDVAKGEGAITWKAKFGRFNGKLVNDLLFGQTVVAGQNKIAIDEIVSVAAASATAVLGAGTLVEDLGVRYQATGKPLVKVASAPALGQYSGPTVPAGVYTFNTGDNGTNNVMLSYRYSLAAIGLITTITNQLMGFGPKFMLYLSQQYGGNQANLKLFRSVATKLTRPTKTDDYTILEIDGEAFADDAGNVFEFSDAE